MVPGTRSTTHYQAARRRIRRSRRIDGRVSAQKILGFAEVRRPINPGLFVNRYGRDTRPIDLAVNRFLREAHGTLGAVLPSSSIFAVNAKVMPAHLDGHSRNKARPPMRCPEWTGEPKAASFALGSRRCERYKRVP